MKRTMSAMIAVCLLSLVASAAMAEQTLVLFDDFSGDLSTNWVTGRSANEGGSPSLEIVDGELEWDQEFDYIETKETFGDDVMIRFDLSGESGSHGLGDFWIELVALTDGGDYTAGIYRTPYGLQNFDFINIGRAPSTATSIVASDVDNAPYLKTIPHDGPREGSVVFVYSNQKVQMRFEGDTGAQGQTVWVPTGSFTSTKIRIWGIGGLGSQRYIDNVRIYAPSGNEETCDCDPRLVVVPLHD